MDHDSSAENPTEPKYQSEYAVPVAGKPEKPDGSNLELSIPEGGQHEAAETERQRIERLGRERPAKLKSPGAEVFFCYSVIASQFMAVSYHLAGQRTHFP